MKCAITVCYALMILCRSGQAQGFVNLDFENAVITLDTSSPYYPNAVYASDAIPGWTAIGGFLGPNDIHYNTVSIGSTDISILGTNGTPPALSGAYSVLLYGGHSASFASISQTGDVPADAVSILFQAQGGGGALLLSLGGQNIPFLAISTGSNYTLYGGNIPSGLAGQSEQLTFAALAGENFWNIDNIQFSSTAVPEPSALALSGLGGLLLLRQCRRKHLQAKL